MSVDHKVAIVPGGIPLKAGGEAVAGAEAFKPG